MSDPAGSAEPDSDLAIVQRLVQSSLEGDTATMEALLSPHFFARLASGRVYAGRDGFTQLVHERIEAYARREGQELEFRELDPGVVLVKGELVLEEVSGAESTLEGAWMLYVREGRLVCIVYFASEAAALRSLPTSVRRPTPVEVVERAIEIFNRGDIPALLGVVSEDFRCTPSPGATPLVGLAELIGLQTLIEERYDLYVMAPYELFDLGGGFVLAEGEVHTVSGPLTTSGKRAVLARVVDGLETEWTVCTSAAEARAEAERRLAATETSG